MAIAVVKVVDYSHLFHRFLSRNSDGKIGDLHAVLQRLVLVTE